MQTDMEALWCDGEWYTQQYKHWQEIHNYQTAENKDACEFWNNWIEAQFNQ